MLVALQLSNLGVMPDREVEPVVPDLPNLIILGGMNE